MMETFVQPKHAAAIFSKAEIYIKAVYWGIPLIE